MFEFFFYTFLFGVALIAGLFSRHAKVPFLYYLVCWVALSIGFQVHPTKFWPVFFAGLVGGGFGYLWSDNQRKKLEEANPPEV